MAYPPDPAFTRREGDELARRVDRMDNDGTRGMQLLAAQTQNNTAAIANLGTELRASMAAHTRQHEQELAAIRGRRRRRYSTALAAWAAAVATLSLLAYIAVSVASLRR